MERTATLLLAVLLGSTLGAQSFQRTHTPANGDQFQAYNQCRLNDGGYLFCGIDWADYDLHVVRLTVNGDVAWAVRLPSDPGQEVMDVMRMGQFANGDVYLLTSVAGPGFTSERVLLRLDDTGTPVWIKKFAYGPDVQPEYTTRASRVSETSTGDIVVNVSASNRTVLTKITAAGSLLWSKSFTSTIDSTYDKHPSFDMQLMNDDGLMICGKDRDWPYLLRTDVNGDLLWTRTYYDVYTYSHTRAMEVLPNGDMLFAGMHDTSAMMMRINSAGVMQWLKHYTNCSYFQSLEALGDGTYIMASDGYGNVVHVDADGLVIGAFTCGNADYSVGLYCVSGAAGNVHMAGSVVETNTWTSYNYLTRFPIASPPECLFSPSSVTAVDIASVVGSSGVTTMEQLSEPVTVSALTWQFLPGEWISDVFCGAAESVNSVQDRSVSVTPTLLASGGTVQVSMSGHTSARAEWFAMNGSLVKRVAFTGSQATLATDGLVPGLYTLRLSADGGVLHTVRIAVQ